MPKFYGYVAKHIIIDPNEPDRPGPTARAIWDTIKNSLTADTIYLMWPLIKADAEHFNFESHSAEAADREAQRTLRRQP